MIARVPEQAASEAVTAIAVMTRAHSELKQLRSV